MSKYSTADPFPRQVNLKPSRPQAMVDGYGTVVGLTLRFQIPDVA